MSLGQRIKHERSRLRLTQAAFAVSVGVSRNQVWKWEIDRDKPGLDKLKRIAATLEKDVNWLVSDGDYSTRAMGPRENSAESRRLENPPHPLKSSPDKHGARDPRIERRLAIQDLSSEKLLCALPRMAYEGHEVPAIGGIPILATLGHGGMSAVYLGYHPRLGLEVAIKVLPLPDRPDLVEQFRREAQLAAKVKSPHLVGVLDVNEEHGTCYQIMEYVRGKSAGGYLREVRASERAGLDEATALEICIAATKGLGAMHSAGIVHRDVKPDNILIPEDAVEGGLNFSNAKLADLGLAQDEDRSAMSAEGAFVGTPAFAAPEQVLNARTVGKPADVFSMGATLYALLCGRAPFADASPSRIMLNVVQHPHVPVQQARGDVSAATATLIDMFCLDKVPEKRCTDALVLLNELELCRASLPRIQPAPSENVAEKALLPAGLTGVSAPPSHPPAAGEPGGAGVPVRVESTPPASRPAADAAPTRQRSSELFRLALREAEKHKWNESAKAGRNLGDAALQDWFWRHGWLWCRQRWIEHLRGEHCWSELDPQTFGFLKRSHDENRGESAEGGLMSEILERVKTGAENVDIIRWAQHSGRDVNRVLEILTQLDERWQPVTHLLAAWNAELKV